MTLEDEDTTRRRALRAARAVTLGVGMALAGAACSSSHTGGDGSVPDASPDAVADSARDADTGIDCSSEDWWDSEECCERSGGFWDPSGGCAVPGPFVPPALPS